MSDFECEHVSWTAEEITEAVDSFDAKRGRRDYWADLDRMNEQPKGTHRDRWRQFLTDLRDGKA